nr:phospholipase A1-II 4-like [Ipomoea trifida]
MSSGIAERWKVLSGSDKWEGLLDPLDSDLCRYLIHYATMVGPASEAFINEPASKYVGLSRYSRGNLLAKSGVVKGNPFKYEVTKYFYAPSTDIIFQDKGYTVRPARVDAVVKESNWIGYVAVATDEGKVALGRRDILIAWRGTKRPSESLANLTFSFVKAPLLFGQNSDPLVHKGWHDMYTTINQDSQLNQTSARDQRQNTAGPPPNPHAPCLPFIPITGHENVEFQDLSATPPQPRDNLVDNSDHSYNGSQQQVHTHGDSINNDSTANSSTSPELLDNLIPQSIVDSPHAIEHSEVSAPAPVNIRGEVARLVELYKDEEISITVTGHSLGSSMATLNATDLAVNPFNNNKDIPVTAFLYASPKVGDENFKNAISNQQNLRVLRITDVNDPVPTLPPPGPIDGTIWPTYDYVDVGEGIAIESMKSDYLKPGIDNLLTHDLMLYMHGIDGFQGSQGGFERQGYFDLAKVNKYQDALKDEYSTPAGWLGVKDNGMVQQEDGTYILDDHEPDETF